MCNVSRLSVLVCTIPDMDRREPKRNCIRSNNISDAAYSAEDARLVWRTVTVVRLGPFGSVSVSQFHCRPTPKSQRFVSRPANILCLAGVTFWPRFSLLFQSSLTCIPLVDQLPQQERDGNPSRGIVQLVSSICMAKSWHLDRHVNLVKQKSSQRKLFFCEKNSLHNSFSHIQCCLTHVTQLEKGKF